ncbi:MAG TPA: hypothetical protein PKA81_10485 [Clostridia bacterium]|nr:hypothetical protein [Clostridia bacterium]
MLDGIHCGDIRIFRHDIGRHRVAVSRDDTRNDEQQRPEQRLDKHQQAKRHRIAKVREARKQSFDLRRGGAFIEREVEAVMPQFNRAADDEHRDGINENQSCDGCQHSRKRMHDCAKPLDINAPVCQVLYKP